MGGQRAGTTHLSHATARFATGTIQPSEARGTRCSREALASLHAVCRWDGHPVWGTEVILFLTDESVLPGTSTVSAPRVPPLLSDAVTMANELTNSASMSGDMSGNTLLYSAVSASCIPGTGDRLVSLGTTIYVALPAHVEPDRLESIRSIQLGTRPGNGIDMSYAHDILLDMDFNRAAFTAAVEDVRSLFRRAELPVVGPSGRPLTLPVLEDDFIAFNGRNRGCTCDPDEPRYHDWGPCRIQRCSGPFLDDEDGSSPFVMDLKPNHPWGVSIFEGRYWFDCKTRRRPYDQAVMLAMIALKYRLGEQIDLETKGSWDFDWKRPPGLVLRFPGWSSSSPVELYEHVFPDRAPVQNILSFEGEGW